jgi:hypothetical protein
MPRSVTVGLALGGLRVLRSIGAHRHRRAKEIEPRQAHLHRQLAEKDAGLRVTALRARRVDPMTEAVGANERAEDHGKSRWRRLLRAAMHAEWCG